MSKQAHQTFCSVLALKNDLLLVIFISKRTLCISAVWPSFEFNCYIVQNSRPIYLFINMTILMLSWSAKKLKLHLLRFSSHSKRLDRTISWYRVGGTRFGSLLKSQLMHRCPFKSIWFDKANFRPDLCVSIKLFHSSL